LLGILIGIAVLVVAALVVFFTRQQDVAYHTGQAPEDVVHNYALALMNKDFEQAYSYLADLQDKPTFEEFRQAFAVGRLTPSQNGIKIGSAEITRDSASVEVIMIYTLIRSHRAPRTSVQPSCARRPGYRHARLQSLGLWLYKSQPSR
jgi:hypothetical protein